MLKYQAQDFSDVINLLLSLQCHAGYIRQNRAILYPRQ